MTMQTIGCIGPRVELLQLALLRAGADRALTVDGIFGHLTFDALKRFQTRAGLKPDGVAGRQTWHALTPYLTGYFRHTIRPGDTLLRLAEKYNTTLAAIETANPGINPLSLKGFRRIIIPLGFPVVPTTVSFTSQVLRYCLLGLAARYPFLRISSLGRSVMGREISCISIGHGSNHVSYNAAHHANEWITTPLILNFIEDYASAYSARAKLRGADARALFELTTLHAIPMVNPDGVDLATGALTLGKFYDNAKLLAEKYQIPFPSGWKANISGIDLNLQYPAGWERARDIKATQGFTDLAPRDYPGPIPLTAPESRAMYDFTMRGKPALTLSYHTQGEVIYWKYLDYEPPNSHEIAQKFGSASGYAVEETPYESGFAGYKDWFIEAFNRPGYTIEAGLGQSPLPLAHFDEIYARNIDILTLGLSVTL